MAAEELAGAERRCATRGSMPRSSATVSATGASCSAFRAHIGLRHGRRSTRWSGCCTRRQPRTNRPGRFPCFGRGRSVPRHRVARLVAARFASASRFESSAASDGGAHADGPPLPAGVASSKWLSTADRAGFSAGPAESTDAVVFVHASWIAARLDDLLSRRAVLARARADMPASARRQAGDFTYTSRATDASSRRRWRT